MIDRAPHDPSRALDAISRVSTKPPIVGRRSDLDFSNRYVVFEPGSPAALIQGIAAAEDAGATVLTHGPLLDELIGFVLVEEALFVMIRWINRRRRSPPTCTDRSHVDQEALVALTAVRPGAGLGRLIQPTAG